MKKNYTTKEILLSLRSEILKLEKEVKKLDDCFDISDEYNMSIRFHGVKSIENMNIELAKKEECKRVLEKLQELIKLRSGWLLTPKTLKLQPNDNGSYDFKYAIKDKNGNEIINIKENKILELGSLIDNIYSLDTVLYDKFYSIPEDESQPWISSLNVDFAELYGFKNVSDSISRIRYFGYEDMFVFNCLKKCENFDEILTLLEQEFMYQNLDESIIELIEENNYREIPIKIYGDDSKSFSKKFNIEEDEKGIYLIKTR